MTALRFALLQLRALTCLLCSLLCIQPLAVGEAIPLDAPRIEHILSNGVIIRSGQLAAVPDNPAGLQALSLAEARMLAAQDKNRAPVPAPSLDWVDGPLWVRVDLVNPTRREQVYRVTPDSILSLFDVEAWLVRPGSPDQQIWRQPILENSFDARWPRHRLSMSEPFSVRPGERAEIWLAFQYGYRSNADYWLIESQTHLTDVEAEESFHAFLFGARAALICAVFLLAFILGLKIAAYYGMFCVFIYLYFLTNYGYSYAHITKNLQLEFAASVLFGGLAMSAFTMMTRAFLNSSSRYRLFDRVLIGTLAGSWVIGIVAAFLVPPAWASHVLLIAILAIAAANFAGATIAVLNRHSGSALYFLASLSLIGVSLFGAAMITTTFLPLRLSRAILHIGFALDTVLFALALIVRAVDLRRERDRATSAEIAALREKSELLARIDDSETAYQHALARAEHYRSKASATIHDLRQPLLSLRLALSKSGERNALGDGISYLESVIARDLAENKHPPETAWKGGRSQQISASKLIDSVATMFADEAAEKSIRLRSAKSALRIEADPVILMRILANLVANAVRHTQAGGILIGARRKGANAVIEVWDSGAGIEAGQIETLFDPYVKAPASEGDGLGLAVVKSLAEEVGLTISLQSEPGRGSVFRIGNIKLAGPA